MAFLTLIIITLSCFSCSISAAEFHSFPVQEKYLKNMYLSLTSSGITIQFKDKANTNPSGMIENDFISHVNGIPVISKGLSDIFDSSTSEMVLPIVDDEDSLDGSAFKLLGFVSLKLINPQSIKVRRGIEKDENKLASNNDLKVSSEGLNQSDKANQKSSPADNKNLKNNNTDQSGKGSDDGKAKVIDQQTTKPNVVTSGSTSIDLGNNEESKEVKIDEGVESFYGLGKKYPEPYLAGKVPAQLVQRKYQSQSMGQPYVYSVRFRSGPIGMSFDNKLINTTRIEKVVSGQPADQSGVQEGDYLIGIDQYDVSNEPAKTSTRILSLLSYPKILVFESRLVINDKKIIEENIASRTYMMKIIYPPALINEFPIRLADWSPPFLWSKENACPILNIRAPVDPFGCDLNASEFELSPFVKAINSNIVNASVVQDNSMPMLKILQSEALRQHINTFVISTAIVKRGICSFVDKSRKLQSTGAEFSIIVNNENILVDIPAGKDKTEDLSLNVGIVKETDGNLLHLGSSATTASMTANSIGTGISATATASMTASYFGNDEVYALITPMNTQYSRACDTVHTMAQEIVDVWPRSNFATEKLIQKLGDITILKSKKRSKEDVGGRVAFGGENGWAFFDYSQALFGSPLPLHPFSFKLAQPMYGCDASKYTVRIADHIVGIIRGGGCSFGIKIINAQKLGAKAVVIINNDESPLMRLMVLPDELSMITIPCIMVSNKVQKYLGSTLKPFYQYDQYILSIQPMAYVGDYEKVIS